VSEDVERWQRWIQGLRDGDRATAQEFWDQYGPPLRRIAEGRLAENLRRRVSPEDVVQSACRTFFRRAGAGEFHLADSEELWRLLCAITLTKVREQARHHGRLKRGMDQEVHAEAGAGFDQVAPGPTPAEAAEFADQFAQLLASMDEEERQMIDLKLQECTHEEVAQRLGCSERTVRRILSRVQARLAKAFDLGDAE
jgi:RNA polymerase sigma factor (sigma-70 family)